MGAQHNTKEHDVQGETAAILIRLPRVQKDALVAAAHREHRSLNGTMRSLVDQYLASLVDEDPDPIAA